MRINLQKYLYDQNDQKRSSNSAIKRSYKAQSASDLQKMSESIKSRVATNKNEQKKEKTWFNKLFGSSKAETPRREKKKGEIDIPKMGPKAFSQATPVSETDRPSSAKNSSKLSQSSNLAGSF